MQKTITLGILETGIIDDHLTRIHGTYPDMFVKMYQAQDPSVIFKFYNVIENHYPQNIDECDAYLITGSKSDSFSNEPWVETLRQYICTLYNQSKSLIGVCFGHQVIAIALGGMAGRSNKGWGIGVYNSKIEQSVQQQKLPWLESQYQSFNLLVSHQDQVSQIPPNATLLASNDFCHNSAYYIEDKVLCFQGHPEISPGFARGLMALREGIIPKDVYQQGLDSSELPLQADAVTRWMLNFIRLRMD